MKPQFISALKNICIFLNINQANMCHYSPILSNARVSPRIIRHVACNMPSWKRKEKQHAFIRATCLKIFLIFMNNRFKRRKIEFLWWFLFLLHQNHKSMLFCHFAINRHYFFQAEFGKCNVRTTCLHNFLGETLRLVAWFLWKLVVASFLKHSLNYPASSYCVIPYQDLIDL